MTDQLKFQLSRLSLWRRQPGSSLLGLAFDGGRLEIAAVSRSNGSVEVKKTVTVSLSLDPLMDEVELVGRELRKHLDAAGVRDRWCVVCLPLAWALTHTTALPELPEADLAEFLATEAERGFPYAPETLMRSHAQFTTANGERYATMVAIPRDHVLRLEAALRAAQLWPVSFSLGIVALPHLDTDSTTISLLPGENHVGLQVTAQGQVAVLRTIEGAFELEGGEKQILADPVARELRITLGQLPAGLRETVQRIRVFGCNDIAEALAEELGPRVQSMGLTVEHVPDCDTEALGVHVPPRTPVSAALCLAARRLANRGTGFEFLPPKVRAWKQFADRYASRKLAAGGLVAGAIALMIALALLVQQWQLVRWRTKWTAIQPRVTELDGMQQQIKQFRPWFSESFRALTLLKQLTEAFPEDGTVAAKTLEIREPSTVTCAGTARDHQALLKTLEKLRAVRGVADVQVEQMRGKTPIQFSFVFHYYDAVAP